MKKKFLLALLVITISIIAFGTISVSAAEAVYVSTVSALQSTHPYSSNMDKTWAYIHSTPADSLEITFSSDTETESRYDFIYIFDANNNQIKKESGTSLAGKTITVPGNVVKIKLTSDGSVTKNGFTVTNIKANVSQTSTIIANGTCGENITWTLNSTGELVISGTGNMTNYYDFGTAPWYNNCSKIKSVVIENGVTSIGWNAFYYCTEFTRMIIPNSVTSIGYSAFYACDSFVDIYYDGTEAEWNSISGLDNYYLTHATIYYMGASCDPILEYLTYTITDGKVTITDCDTSVSGELIIPSTIEDYPVTNIGDDAFSSCEDLTNIIIPSSVTSIGNNAFVGCLSLTNITIPESVTSIGDYAFYGCSSFTSITIPDGITSISRSAFGDCTNLTEVKFPSQLTSIEKSAFSGCESLANIIIPDSVTTIGDDAFTGCESLVKIIIPDSVTSIGDNAFIASGLTNITIGNCVTSIGKEAFKYCGLTSIIIPDSVTSIGKETFGYCGRLTSIVIPDSVTCIDENAFEYCDNLKNVYYTGTESEWMLISVANGNAPLSLATIHYNYDPILEYLTYTITDGKVTITNCDTNISGKLIIPPTINGYPVKAIGDDAFADCENLTSVIIPEGVEHIGNCAFGWCDGLQYVSIPNSVTYIGNRAFYGCDFSSISIPDGVTYIGDGAFASCMDLSSISIPNSVTYIGEDIIYNTRYANENYNSDVIYIGKHLVKANMISTTSYSIKSGTLTVAASAFDLNCTKLTNLSIPDSVISIGNKAFYGCENLTNITVSQNNVCYMSEDGILFNKSKTELIQYPAAKTTDTLIIPEYVTQIADYAFYKCKNLTNITIPNSVISIGTSAFDSCYKFKDVYYNGTADNWDAITIGEYNDKLNNATKHYFAYIILLDKDEKQITSMAQNMNECIDTSAVDTPEGYNIVLYIDKELTKIYDVNAPIVENLTLYVEFMKLNKIEFEGTATADIGEKGITQSVSFATDKISKYFSCTLKVPNSLEIQEIKSDIFEVEQDHEVIDNDTHYYLFLIYNGDGNIPKYQTLNAFEVVFDVSKNAVADETIAIEILDDAILVDDDGNSYEFTSIEKAEIKINPILAEEITIVGADEIDTPTQYTVSVLPANTTNKTVEWSVSDETIATISEDGVLTPVKKGNVTVRATAKDGSGVYDEKTVSVKVLGTVNSITTNIGLWDKEYSPDTTNYTIYVPESTTSIRLTAKHDGTFKTDKTTFVNNVTRTVTLSTTSDETVLDLVYTCEGYDNNKYTITIIKFEGTKTEVSEDKKSFSITPINVENGKTVILALYNGEQFVEMQSAVYTGEVVPFTTTKTYTKAKVMVWDDITNLKPVCEVENVQ